jgi:dipeptidase E
MKLFLTSKFHFVAHSIATKLSDEQKQQVVFITTPFKYRKFKESELDWHYYNLEAMKKYGYNYEFYDITGKTSRDIERDLAKHQTMYVEGGNPFFFMQEAAKNHFGDYIKKRLDSGMIYISESAGSVCAGVDIAANSRPGKSLQDYDLSNSNGFGLVNFAILPHWGQKEKREDYLTYKIPQSYKEDFPYILLSNNQYVEVQDDWYQIVDITTE